MKLQFVSFAVLGKSILYISIDSTLTQWCDIFNDILKNQFKLNNSK